MLEVERKDFAEGTETFEFGRVLFVGGGEHAASVGHPVVEGAKVTASILGEIKGTKLVIQKYRRRKHSRTKMGHRQKYLRIKIDKIEV